ncbi:MAG: GntR family transcriptional regulator [Acidobacteria bacterium]|nr:GntR family transcriptional regulator [Acidobacteriota bacterium]
MLLDLTDLSSEPLQAQIVRQIRAHILAGNLGAGADLPSIRKMASDQRISVITVQRAYESLEREGLIHSRRGKGFFVSEFTRDRRRDLAAEKLRESVQPVIREALAEGLDKEAIQAVIGTILREV